MRIHSAPLVLAALIAFVPSLASECRKPVACVTVSHARAADLRASVTLAAGAADGVLSIEEIASGPPASIILEWGDVSCGADRDLELFLNDARFPIDAGCAPGVRIHRIDDAAGIADAWREAGPNAIRLVESGRDGAIAWARVRAGDGLASPSTRLFEAGAGSLRGAFEAGGTLVAGAATVPRVRIPFSASRLPASIDISSLSDGAHALCVGSGGRSDCVSFVHQGEPDLQIQAAAGGVPFPTAIVAPTGSAECSSRSGALVELDGSSSTGGVVQYEWFENYESPYQLALGQGAQIQVTLPLGSHNLTLKVTDGVGQSDTADAVRTVVDTVAPVVRIAVTPRALWPPDHRMVAVTANPIVSEACSDTTVVLMAVTSNEPDDAPGDLDGNTTGDVQEVSVGTDDRAFSLRAETGPIFGGRRYQIVYSATDASGNTGLGRVAAAVQAVRKPFHPADDLEGTIRLRP